MRTLGGHASIVYSVAFSPNGKTVAAGGGAFGWGRGDDTIKLWNVSDGSGMTLLKGHTEQIWAVAFSPDGKLLASGSLDKTVKLWDVASGRVLNTLSGHTEVVDAVAFSPDGKVLASGSWDKTIKLWDIATGRELRTLSGHTDKVGSVAFSPDGKTLASTSVDGTVRLWDVASGSVTGTTTEFDKSVVESAVAFSPDGKLLALGGSDATIKLIDPTNGQQLRILAGHTAPVTSLAFSPDGRSLASSSWDQTIKLWDTVSGRELSTLRGHSSWVEEVAFSPDGKTLASGGFDGTTREWDVATAKERVALIAFFDGSSVAITPEGYFDSSSTQAEDYLNVRIGSRVFGIGSYREKFYRPALVKQAIAGASLAALPAIGGETLPPTVELVGTPQSTTDPNLKLTLRLTDAGGGVGLVRLFLNGSAVIQDDTVSPPGVRMVLRSYVVPLLTGPNELRVVAFTADGSVQSNDATAQVNANLPPTPKGTLYAVVVGIQDFPKAPEHNLTNPVADATLFADTLRKGAEPLFEKLDIKLLTTAAETDKDHVVQALKAIQAMAGPDDEFIFFVASHGIVADGVYYLVTSNVGGDPARLKVDAISRQELSDLLGNVKATKKLAIIDTCHAGALGDALVAAKGMDGPTAATLLSNGLNLTVLAATATDQEAIDSYKDHGLFTWVVAEGLSGKAADIDDGIVDNDLLAHYVSKHVGPLALNLYQHEQVPTVIENGRSFAITKVK